MPEATDYTPHDSVIANAFCCQDVIEGTDRLISAIKIVDNVNYRETENSPVMRLFLVAMFKATDEKKNKHMDLFLFDPDGVSVMLGEGTEIKFGSNVSHGVTVVAEVKTNIRKPVFITLKFG